MKQMREIDFVIQKPERCLIMILDSITVKILSSIMKLKDLIDMGNCNVNHNLSMMHSISQRLQMIQQIGQQMILKFQLIYRKINVIFSYNLPQRLLKQICKQNLANRILQIKEFNHHLYFLDDNAFHFEILQIYIDDQMQLIQLFLPSLRPFQSIKLSTIKNNQFSQLFANCLPRLLDSWDRTDQMVKDEGGELHFLILDRTFKIMIKLDQFQQFYLLYRCHNMNVNRFLIKLQI
ncbi:unnamed protein product [Paramecium primaurelia]|uniref:Uncharacterized protein n=1 Tax=Paramecium primaurelia TaxID=5886 RepID=A0A8S1JSD0_PARPR|nr:unnamed protein product [Paramecium primaurelia]